jgi:hypothetical protein
MRSFAAVLLRELRERWMVVPAALLLGLFPFLAGLLPGQARSDAEARSGTALGICLILSLLLAAILGATVVARDLGERRLGFYFSRPLAGWAIAAGKLAAAALTALGAGLLALVPVALAGQWRAPASVLIRSPRDTVLGFSTDVLHWVASVLFVLLLAHAVSVMVRSRSIWLLLDLTGAVVVAAVAWRAGTQLRFRTGIEPQARLLDGLLLAAIVALAAAAVVQITRGRTDLRRGHALLSLTLWSLLGVSALGAVAYTRWLLDVELSDLNRVDEVVAAPRGSWIAVSGNARHRSGYEPTFLLDPVSGRSLRIESTSSLPWSIEPLFSGDGRQVAWIEIESANLYRFYSATLGPGRLRRVATPVFLSDRPPQTAALSPDGRRLAYREGSRLAVVDLATGRLLSMLPLAIEREDWLSRLWFTPSGALQFATSTQSEGARALRVWTVDLAHQHLEPASPPIEIGYGLWTISPDARRLLSHVPSAGPYESKYLLIDVATGRRLAQLDTRRATSTAAFLADGRVVALGSGAGRISLHVLSPEGALERTVELPGEHASLAGEPLPGHLLLSILPQRIGVAGARCLLLDLATGAVREIGQGLTPIAWPLTGPESIGSHLLRRHFAELVRWDPQTGKLVRVLPVSR